MKKRTSLFPQATYGALPQNHSQGTQALAKTGETTTCSLGMFGVEMVVNDQSEIASSPGN